MLIDANDLPDDTVLRADVCIVGGGPAGLALADALEGSHLRVVLLERGGVPGRPLGIPEPELEATDADFQAPPAVTPRLGGGANEWVVRMPWYRRSVRMLPMPATDFEQRDWIPHSGWPLTRSDLDPYYEQAYAFLGIPPLDDDRTGRSARHRPLPLEEHGFGTSIERFADPRVFTSRVVDRLAASDNVDVVLHATGGMLDSTGGGRIDRLEIDAGRPGRLTARAELFVLACGGLGNAGLLLGARRGVGVGNDNVGRYFVDHVRTIAGHLVTTRERPPSSYGLYDFRRAGAQWIGGKLVTTAEAQQRHGLLASALQLYPKPPPAVAASMARTRQFVGGLRNGRLGLPPTADIASTAAHVLGVLPEMAVRQRRLRPWTDAGWSGVHNVDRHYDRFELDVQTELAPDPTNRITLSDTRRDEMGRPRQTISWRWTDLDLDSLHRTRDLLGSALAASGVGRLDPADWGPGPPPLTTPGGAFHPSGSTRMSATPGDGVVDVDGRVHGEPSVAVLGSSVFPTSGYVNPTLTILALALRLAESLRNAPTTLIDLGRPARVQRR